MPTDVLGGLYLDKAHFGALRCHCMEGTLYGPDSLQMCDVVRAVVRKQSATEGTRRVWARYSDELRGVAYLSGNPGGFRREPPPQEDLVLEVSEEDVVPMYLPKLKELSEEFADEKDLAAELGAAKRLLDGNFKVRSQHMLVRMNALYQLPHSDAHAKLTREISELYDEGLHGYGMSLADFSAAMGLCQLYVAGLGKAERGLADGDNWSKVRAIARHASVDARTRGILNEFLNSVYEDAEKCKRGALAATSMMDHHRHAYTALHLLLLAIALVRDYKWRERSYHQLDEAYACGVEFLGLSGSLYSNNPFDVAKMMGPMRGEDLTEWRAKLSWQWSSGVHPVIPTFLFDLLTGYAEFLWRLDIGEESPDEALRRLIETGTMHERESESVEVATWYDVFIRHAAILIGDESESKLRARKIANRLTVRAMLGH